MSAPATPSDARREAVRRGFVLLGLLAVLAAGLWGFYARQSLLISLRPSQVTRTLLPTAFLDVSAVAARSGEAQGVPVLVYHGIQPVGSSCNVTPETFQDHMAALRAAGYVTLTMEQFRTFVEGKAPAPRRSVLITFDDGRTDSFAGADPVLRAFGFHASMFAILGDIRSGKAFYLTQAETAMMAATGRWDVQSHTVDSHVMLPVDSMGHTDHALPNRLWDVARDRLESDAEYEARVTGDLTESRDTLAAIAGRTPIALAYPWGDDGSQSADPLIRRRLHEIADSLFPLTFRQAGATVDETYDYPFDRGSVLRRVYVTADMSAEALLARLARGEPKSLPFKDPASFRSTGWALSSGQLAPAETGRVLVSTRGAANRRAECFLDGSRAWQEYAIRTRFRLDASSTVSLVARRADANDYVAATISRTYVSIEQVIRGRSTVLAHADIQPSPPPGALCSVTFRVKGRTAALDFDGRRVATARSLDATVSRGGVGVRDDPGDGRAARLELDRFSVVPVGPAAGAVASLGTRPSEVVVSR